MRGRVWMKEEVSLTWYDYTIISIATYIIGGGILSGSILWSLIGYAFFINYTRARKEKII
tara:strand:+ start:860 stop:1039 length:180 start_codon:yes stop_codon:yes gene_type:complete